MNYREFAINCEALLQTAEYVQAKREYLEWLCGHGLFSRQIIF